MVDCHRDGNFTFGVSVSVTIACTDLDQIFSFALMLRIRSAASQAASRSGQRYDGCTGDRHTN